jgi:hypothetical protein
MTRREALLKFRITDHQELRIRAVHEGGYVWCVGINGPGEPMTVLLSKEAVELAIALREAGEDRLASDVLRVAEQAVKANETGQP